MGAITLAMMLYLIPSLARVSVKPTWPNLAAIQCQPGPASDNRTQSLTGVVSLAKATEQTCSRSRVDNTTILLFPEVRPSSLCALVSAIGVHFVDKVPVLVLHVLKADIAEDTGVVNEDIHATEVLDSGVYDGFTILDAVVAGNGLASGGSDFVYYDICGLLQSACNKNISKTWFSGIPLTTCPHRRENRPGRSRRHWRLLKQRRWHMPFPDHHRHQ